MTSFDCIVIGGGHNGMTASTILAKSGRKVLLIEASAELGGMGKTIKDFHGLSMINTINHLNSEVINALELKKFGFEESKKLLKTISLAENKEKLIFKGPYGSDVLGINNSELQAWLKLRKRLFLQSSVLKKFVNSIPVQENITFQEKINLAFTALNLRLKGKDEFQEFFRMVLMCIADIVEETLSSDLLKGLLCFDATLGIKLGPRSPTSLIGLLYRLSGEVNGHQGGQVFPKGGMDNLIQCFYKSLTQAGVSSKFNEVVSQIITEDGKAIGVKIASGKEYYAKTILSAVSPIMTFKNLVGFPKLDTGFVRAINCSRHEGNTSKLLLALNKLPEITDLNSELLDSRFIFAPSIETVEKGFNPSKYNQISKNPTFEFTIPSFIDPSLSPSDISLVSVTIQNTPYNINESWDKYKSSLQNLVIKKIEHFSPGFSKSIIKSKFLSPMDIENSYLVPGGHWHHSELQVDRMYSLRPAFGFADYKSPIEGLYICGAGTHPGGGISGSSGLNAARKILNDQKGRI